MIAFNGAFMTPSTSQIQISFPDRAVVGKVFLSRADGNWTFHCQAQGTVNLPPEAKVRLEINEEFFLHYPTLEAFPYKGLCYLGLGEGKTEQEHLNGLASFSQLEKLSLAGMSLSTPAFEALCNLNQLKALDLSGTFLSNEVFPLLVKLTNLQSLILSHSSVIDQQIVQLTPLCHLQVLHLNKTAIGDDGLMVLEAFSLLKELRLGNRVSDLGLSHLRFCPELLSLDLAETQCTDAGMIKIGELKELRSLSLPEQLSSQGFHNLAELEKLESLILESKYLVENDFQALSRFPSLSALITGAMFETDAVEHFQPGKSLKRLILTAQTLRPELIAQIAKHTHLESLKLSSMAIGNNDLWCFEEFHLLKRLHFYTSALTHGGFKWLQQQSPQCKITHSPTMAFEGNRVISGTLLERMAKDGAETDWRPSPRIAKGTITFLDREYSFRCCGDIADSLVWLAHYPTINLVEIKLTGCVLTQENIKALETFHGLVSLELTQCQLPELLDSKFPNSFPALQKLSLNYSKPPLSWFQIFPGFPQLESVELVETPFGDEDLIELKECTTLKELDLRKTLISNSAIMAFAEKNPGITILSDF